MELPLLCLVLFAGIFSNFLMSILNNISQDKINSIIETNYKTAQKLQNLINELEYEVNSFHVLELIFIAIGTYLLGLFASDQLIASYINKIALLWLPAVIIVAYTGLRYLLQAIAIRSADSIALGFAPFIFLFNAIGSPIANLLKKASITIIGEGTAEESREEITQLVESAHEDGAIELGEYRILKNIMNFSEVLVADVMTPRTVIFSADADKTVEELLTLQEIQMYSRFPIWEGDSIDDGIIGYVMTKDIYEAALKGRMKSKLREFVREVYFIPENADLDIALDRFLNRRQHLFVVVDEYGGIEGLITMEDVLETMLGAEIVDEADKVVDLRQLAKKRRDNRIAQINP